MSISANVRTARAALIFLSTVAGACAESTDQEAGTPVVGRTPDAALASDAASDAVPDQAHQMPDAGRADALAGDAADHHVPVGGICHQDEDCRLVDDCCSCLAVPNGQVGPGCDPRKSCLMTACTQYGGVERARCVAGRCVVGFDCDTATVTCKRQPPVCPPGQTPLAVGKAADRCYGECVDAQQCAAVPACGACAPADLCLHTPGVDEAIHCVPWPASCAGTATCACGFSACVAPFGICVDPDPNIPGLVCEPSG
jgi:hypothetical protein